MTAKFARVIMVVIDGLGMGSAPDADRFADQGSDTMSSLVRHFRARLQLPVLARLGLGEVHPLFNQEAPVDAHTYYGQTRATAVGKTALEGIWELLGVPTTEEFTAFPQGFPQSLLTKAARYTHRPIIGNQPATPLNGLSRWGSEQVATGGIIVFTSGGSDLWVTAHEATLASGELWRVGRYLRQLFDQQEGIRLSQVIAVPFSGDPVSGYAYRPTAAKVLPMPAPRPTVIDRLRAAGVPVRMLSSQGNDSKIIQKLGRQLVQTQFGLWVTRLVDVDRAGRQRNPEKMGQFLRKVDRALGELLPTLTNDDLLILTATHGNDPDFPGTAITREWLPLLAYSPQLVGGRLTDRTSLTDVATLILENFDLASENTGNNLLTLLK